MEVEANFQQLKKIAKKYMFRELEKYPVVISFKANLGIRKNNNNAPTIIPNKEQHIKIIVNIILFNVFIVKKIN